MKPVQFSWLPQNHIHVWSARMLRANLNVATDVSAMAAMIMDVRCSDILGHVEEVGLDSEVR